MGKNKKNHIDGLGHVNKHKKILIFVSVIVMIVLVSPFIVSSSETKNSEKEHNLVPNHTRFIAENNHEKILNGYTMAIIRPDHPISTNHGDIEAPFPSSGNVLIPTNFMCLELCEVVQRIHSESEMDTLKKLERYDQENLVHDKPGGPYPQWAEDYTILHPTGHKESAQEMFAYAKTYGKVTGECYAQACFNTAILRMAGFSVNSVFTLKLPGHAINLVKADDRWWVLDSTYAPDPCLFEEYNIGTFRGLENDKYYVSFEHGFSNMDYRLLKKIVQESDTTMGSPDLAGDWTDINDFIENADYPPEMVPKGVPFDVHDTTSAEELVEKNTKFCQKMARRYRSSQYDKAMYASNSLKVENPEVHAEAAIRSTWTQATGEKLCSRTYCVFAEEVLQWISNRIETKPMYNDDQIAYPDIPILVEYGSTMDKALVAYGIARNTWISAQEIPANDVYVIVTEDNNGYLALKTRTGWKYLNFEDESLDPNAPNDIKLIFNEEQVLDNWENLSVSYNGQITENIIIYN
jgi:hypothetical protein